MTTTTGIRVSIVENIEEVREHYAALLNRSPGFSCVSKHPNAHHALKHLPSSYPDVVLIDIRMPRMTGIDLVRRLRAICPNMRPVMLTQYFEDDLIFESLKAGALGYLLKRCSEEEILHAVRQVYQGGSPMTPEIARKVAQFFQEKAPQSTEWQKLSPREDELLHLARRGPASKEIADALGISLNTVNNHFRHIYEKLHVNSRAAALNRYFGDDG